MAGKRNGRASGWIGWLRRKIAGANGRGLEEALRRLSELEEKVRLSEERWNAPPIVIEQVRIEKVAIDKIEHHNYFGALGIKELGGRLNIGANYMLTEDMLPAEGAEGLEALRQARAAAQRGRSGNGGAAAAGGGGAARGGPDKCGREGGRGSGGSGVSAGADGGRSLAGSALGRAGAGPKVGIRGQPSSIPR